MKTKNLEDQVSIDGAAFHSTSKKINMEYFLIHDRESNTYGVEIICRKSETKNPDEYEFASFTNIFKDYISAKNLVKKLSANLVTPIELKYVLEDLYII